MNNFKIDVVCVGTASLRLAVDLAFTQHNKVTHYAIREAEPAVTEPEYSKRAAKPKRLVFMWTGDGRDAVKLPFTLDAEGATDFARRWLEEQDYGREPDHDGDNGKGWRAYCEGWGHVDNEYQGFLAIAPAWDMYGK